MSRIADSAHALAELPDIMATLGELHDTADGEANRPHPIDGKPRPAEPGLTRPAPTGRRTTPGSRPPVSLAPIALLDQRTRTTGDDAVRYARLNGYAGDLRQGVLPTLWLWARMVEAEMMETSPTLPEELPEQPCVSNVCNWLRHHLDWIEQQQWAVEFHDDMTLMHREVRKAIGDPIRKPYVPRHQFDAGGCGFPIEPRDGGTWLECTGCRKQWVTEAEIKRVGLLQLRPRLEWARERGVSPAALRMRLKRAGVEPEGRDKRGRALYSAASVDRALDRQEGA